MSCTGNETKLVDCFHPGGNHNCRLGTDDAGVVCTGTHIVIFIDFCVFIFNMTNIYLSFRGHMR